MTNNKKKSVKKTVKSKQKFNIFSILRFIKKPFIAIKKRITNYLSRRPHRSFRLTRRRDYKKELILPGYFKFTKDVNRTLWKNRKIFILLAIVFIIFTAIMVKVGSQDTYDTIVDTFNANSAGGFDGFWGEVGKAGILFIGTATGGLNGSLSESQQIFGVLIILLTWLSSVWLLRNILAGHKVKLRDGLYNSAAPLLPTFLVALLLIVQLLPVALAVIGYSVAAVTGILSGGVEAMLFWFTAGFLTLISLYFITSTLFALVIITLPGMYPFKAIKTAGDLIIGRRIRILLRFIWMAVVVILTWAIIMIPLIIFDSWIKGVVPTIAWLPIIPVIILLLTSTTVIWVSSYIYLLYRKVISNESAEA